MAKHCTVLVVEDEPLIRWDLTERLEQTGCQTLEAGSAEEAISILEIRPDITVVFTDIQMPGTMDGIQLAQFVRKRWPPTIIVISSGRVEPKRDVLAEDIVFVAKPYNNKVLSSVIAEVRQRLANPPST